MKVAQTSVQGNFSGFFGGKFTNDVIKTRVSATSCSIETIVRLFYELKFTETSFTGSNCDCYGEGDSISNCRVRISISH